jgi:hypothetical protein
MVQMLLLKTMPLKNNVTPRDFMKYSQRKYSKNEEVNKSEAPSGVGKMTINMVASRLKKILPN